MSSHVAVFGLEPVDRRAKLRGPIGDVQLLELAADIVGADAELCPSRRIDGNDPVDLIEYELRCVGRLERGLAHAQVIRHVVRHRAPSCLQTNRRSIEVVQLRNLPEDPALQIDRREHGPVAEQHLGAPEHEIPARVQREIESSHDAILHVGVEVHQRVPADQEIDLRDRRILDEVVAAEDDGAPQLPVEDDLVPRALEVLGHQRLGNVLELPVRVDRLPRFRQRFLVDVGCVDLDALAQRVHADVFGQHHGRGVRLLARRAARAPDPERIAVGPLLDQTRQQIARRVRPDIRIAEERRDVDEDGVEERAELLLVDLEVVEVFLERLDAHLLHPLHEAAHQARSLVRSEIEAARLAEMIENLVEVRRIGAHRHTHQNVPQWSRLKQR